MTDTTRDLIQRLTKKLDLLHCQYNVPNQSVLIDEAHAYLDQPEPLLEKQRCENCRYYLQSSNECRRNAPQPSVSRHIYSAWWPVVADGDWCGEWVKR